MNTDEIAELTEQSVRDLIRVRTEGSEPFPGHERRRAARWPFPGTVEIQSADGEPGQWFATCRNISETGLGMACDRGFDQNSLLEIAIHLPEATLYGRAIVRYCQGTPAGFMTGIEFLYPE